MKIFRGYKTELELNNQQRSHCLKHAGAARFAYNWGLARRKATYQATAEMQTAIDLHKELNRLKKTELSGKRFGVQHETKGGGKRKLGAHIPGNERIEECQDGCGDGQRVEPGLLTSNPASKDDQRPHDGSPHDSRIRTHQDCVKADGDNGDDGPKADTKQPPKQHHKEASDDCDVESGNCNDVGGASIPKFPLQIRRNIRFHA